MIDYEKFCERCKYYDSSLERGILCALTNDKPAFDGKCPRFVVNPELEPSEEHLNEWKKRVKFERKRERKEKIALWLILLIPPLLLFAANKIYADNTPNWALLVIGIVVLILLDSFLIILVGFYSGTKKASKQPKFANTVRSNTNGPSLDYDRFCLICKHYSFDLSRGILCGLTQEKPSFTDICQYFEPDPERQAQLARSQKSQKIRQAKTDAIKRASDLKMFNSQW